MRTVQPSRTGDVETWILVEESTMFDRLSAIADRCRAFISAPAQDTTAHGLALDVLALADAEIAARRPKCPHTYVRDGAVDRCIRCRETRA